MKRYVDADEVLGFRFYEEEIGWNIKDMPVIDFLRAFAVEDVRVVMDITDRRGHWIKLSERSAQCSKCGRVIITHGIDKTQEATIVTGLYPYCPECSAYMGGK